MEGKVKTKEKQLLLMAIGFTVFQLVGVILYSIGDYFDLAWTMESVLMAVMCFVMYYSYKNHTKNIMKPVIGASLMMILDFELLYAGYYIQYPDYYAQYYENGNVFTLLSIVQVGLFASIIIINIMHYVINSTHHSSPGKVKFNNVMFCIYGILIVVEAIVYGCLGGDLLVTISDVISTLADIFMIAMVIIIERSLDEFRIQREELAKEQ